MDDQLRRRSVGVPAARSLLLTVLGEYVLPRGDAVWHETLVSAWSRSGYSPAGRAPGTVAQHPRRVADERAPRAPDTRVPSDRAAECCRTGAARIYSFGEPWAWDGRWLVLIVRVPEERREVRHQVRTRLAWAGLGSLGGGVWLTPHVEREAELATIVQDEPAAETTSFIATLGNLGSAAAVAAAGWDLAAVREHYETFIDQFRRVATASPQRCFRIQTLLVHAWRKFPFLDPDLPAELLAASWPRRRAHELFARQHDTLAAPARAFFDELEAGRSAEAARVAGVTAVPASVRLPVRGGELELLDIPGRRAEGGLVLLHEGLGSVGLWRGFPERLAAATGLRTVAFSRYGHGQSDPPPGSPHAGVHARGGAGGPARGARSTRDRRAGAVGHSDGASIALIYAARHSSSVRAVAAIAPHVFVEEVGLAEIRAPARPISRVSSGSGWPATTAIPTRPSTAGTTSGSIPSSSPGI